MSFFRSGWRDMQYYNTVMAAVPVGP
jgi:hypothetical protein